MFKNLTHYVQNNYDFLKLFAKTNVLNLLTYCTFLLKNND